MAARDSERTLENIARLRRVERKTPSPDIAAVREDLESQLGGTVPRSTAARLLGVSHTAVSNWIASGDVPVVLSRQGRKEVPISPLLDLEERVAEQRRLGRRKLHTLEPVMLEARGRAERLRPPHVSAGPDGPHRIPELRSLAYHRALAPRLRRPMVEAAQRKLRRWLEEGKIAPLHAETWEEVFAQPMAKIRDAITADDQRGRDLRQNSPLAGLLSEPERRKVLELA
jgi:predicted transcriptional regulator